MRDIQIFILPLLPFWICLCILGIHFWRSHKNLGYIAFIQQNGLREYDWLSLPSLSREEGWVILVTGPLPVVRYVSVGGVIAALRVSGARSGHRGIPSPHAAQRRNLWQHIVETLSMFPPLSPSWWFHIIPSLQYQNLYDDHHVKTTSNWEQSKMLP